MPSGPSDRDGIAAEISERLATQAAEIARRKKTRTEQRKQLTAARIAGLTKRNTRRLDQAQRSQIDAEPPAAPDPIPSDRQTAAQTPQTTRTTRRGIS